MSLPIIGFIGLSIMGKPMARNLIKTGYSLVVHSRAAQVLKPTIKLNVLEDVPDNRILECAVEAGADLVVTGDRHLLQLKKFQGIPIIRLVDFLGMFPGDVN